ncbi:MAG: hypothetical protein AB3N33_00780 [Puniceicoccaceae bacterium]
MKRLTATAIVSILGGTLIHLAVLTVIRIEAPVTRAPYEITTAVSYVGDLNREAAPAILEQAALFDSAPLFMPTRWNPASQMAEVASLQEATEIFDRFQARLRLPAFEPHFPGAPGMVLPRPALPDGPAFTLARYGRVPSFSREVVSPGPTVHISSLKEGSADLPESTPLPESLQTLSPPALWTPVQFYLHVSEGAPVGIPMLAQSSGFIDWDQALQGFVASLDFYRQLGDGYYHLLVYP